MMEIERKPPGTKDQLVGLSGITFEGDTVRKRGDEYRLRREEEAMQFVRSKTSIPIPEVLDTHFDPDGDWEQNWILMEKVPGTQMGIAWPSISKTAQSHALSQLRGYLQELHSIRPPEPGWIGSCSHGPAYDHRIDNRKTCGPFSTISEFHDLLLAPLKTHGTRPDWVVKYRNRLLDTHHICFAHADLSDENILIDPGTGTITAMLDWEMAKFWPSWWEYRKALYGSRPRPWWYAVLKEIMQEYRDETEADMDLEWC
jgi:serine/threonine protein kinase